MDSPLMRFLTKIADLMILNILFLITCLPVVTIGAAWTSLYYVALKMVRDEESSILRAYFRAFKQNFRQSTILWLGILAVGALVVLDVRIVNGVEGSALISAARVGIELLTLAALMVLQYLFPALSRFETSILNAIKNACIMTVCHFPQSFVMTVFSVGCVFITFLNEYTLTIGILVWLMLGFALVAFGNASILVKIFDKYTPKAENSEPPC